MAKPKNIFDAILVIDIEATCWEGHPPAGEYNDIIEIGAALLDLGTRHIDGPWSYYVIPSTSSLSEFCVSLTKITPTKLLMEGKQFQQTCHTIMEDLKSRKRPWVSWGNYDRTQTERQCIRESVPFPFGNTHWNMKDLYTVRNGLQEGIGLGKALTREGLEFIGQPHSGRDDAFNIARLFAKLVLGWENV